MITKFLKCQAESKRPLISFEKLSCRLNFARLNTGEKKGRISFCVTTYIHHLLGTSSYHSSASLFQQSTRVALRKLPALDNLDVCTATTQIPYLRSVRHDITVIKIHSYFAASFSC